MIFVLSYRPRSASSYRGNEQNRIMSQEPTITTAVAGMKDISSYEELRQSNIKRNAEFLETIGIHAESVDTHSILKKKKRSPAVVQTAVQVPAPAATVFPTRRSTRVAVQDAVNYNESAYYKDKLENVGFTQQQARIKPTSSGASSINITAALAGVDMFSPHKYTSAESKLVMGDGVVPVTAAAAATTAIAIAGQKPVTGTKAIKANTKTFLTERLGKAVETFGKAAVVTIANNGVQPSFSKYTGLLEWSNCIFLWVNLDGGSGYDNCFSEEGRFITWFGGSRMYKETAVIQRMLLSASDSSESKPKIKREEVHLKVKREEVEFKKKIKKEVECISAVKEEELGEAESKQQQSIRGDNSHTNNSVRNNNNHNNSDNDDNSDNNMILLFVRHEGEPYIPLGRLRVAKCNLEVHPVQFEFELLDVTELRTNSDAFRGVAKF